MPEELLRGLRVADMGAHRDGEEGAPALPWKNVQLQHFSSQRRTEKEKMLPQDRFHGLQIYPNCDCGRGGSAPDPAW